MIKEVAPGIFLGTHTIVKMDSASSRSRSGAKEAVTTEITLKTDDQVSADKIKIAPWGEDNDEPQQILSLIGKIGVAGRGILTNISAHFGSGLTLYEEDEAGQRNKVGYRKYPKVVEFDKRNYINHVALELITDLEPLGICFLEFVLSKDFKTINRVKRQNSAFCRFEVKNKTTGRIERVALNADWVSPDHKFTKILPCFSPYDYYEDVQSYCQENKIYNFIIPFFLPKNGEIYYNKPFFHAPLKNGWADVVLSIPAVKKAMADQQTHFKFLIHVSEKYFQISNGTDENGGYVWDSFSPEEQSKKKRELVNAFDEHMSGTEAAGRSLTVPMLPGPDGKMEETVKIAAVDDKLKDGAYLPDATAANTEILFAMGVDPSIVGVGIPGGKNLSGSGSDKREAYTILCANKTADRTISLLPFYFIRDWNQWGDNLDFGFPNVNLTTLDKNPNGQEEILN